MLIIAEVIVKSLYIRFYDLNHSLFSEGRHYEHLIHIDVVLECAVLDPSLQLFPKVIAIIHCQTFNVCFDAIMLIGGKIRLHLSQSVQRCGKNGMPFPILGSPAILISILLLGLAGFQSDVAVIKPHVSLFFSCHVTLLLGL